MKKLFVLIISAVVSSISYGGKVTAINGHPAPADVNLDWEHFNIRNPFEEISDFKYDLDATFASSIVESVKVARDLAWQMSISHNAIFVGNPYENREWISSGILYESLINNAKVKRNPKLLGDCSKMYVLHFLGANSMQAKFTQQLAVNQKIENLNNILKVCDREDNLSKLLFYWQSLYFEEQGHKNFEWSSKIEFDKFRANAKFDPKEKQLEKAIIFRNMSYNGQSSESRFEYFEKEIFPSYIENGIYFSPLLARFPPFFDRESIMNDVESVYQNMMMLKYAKTSAFKPNDAKPNVDK